MIPQSSSSSSPTVSPAVVPYKNNLLVRLGGKSNLDMILISFCGSLHQDPALMGVFGSFCTGNGMVELQRKTMDYAFADFAVASNPKRAQDGALSRLSLHYFCLLQNRDLTRENLDRILQLLSEALQEGWVDDEVLLEATQAYRKVLESICCGGEGSMADSAFPKVVDQISDSLREELVVDATRHIQTINARQPQKGGRRALAGLVQSIKNLRPSSVTEV